MKVKSVNAISSKKVSRSIINLLSRREEAEGGAAKVDLGKLASELAQRKMDNEKSDETK